MMVMFGLMTKDEHEDWGTATGYRLSQGTFKLLMSRSRSSEAYGGGY